MESSRTLDTPHAIWHGLVMSYYLIILSFVIALALILTFSLNAIENRRRARLTPEQRVKEAEDDEEYNRTGGL